MGWAKVRRNEQGPPVYCCCERSQYNMGDTGVYYDGVGGQGAGCGGRTTEINLYLGIIFLAILDGINRCYPIPGNPTGDRSVRP